MRHSIYRDEKNTIQFVGLPAVFFILIPLLVGYMTIGIALVRGLTGLL